MKLDFLKKKIEEKRAEEKQQLEKRSASPETVDMKQVDKIVDQMKRKYKEQGVEMEEVGGKLKELRGIITEGQGAATTQSVEDLVDFKSPAISRLGKFYLNLRFFTEPMTRFISKMPQIREIDFYLYSANMKYSARQYVALSVAAALIVFFASLIVCTVLLGLTQLNLLLKIFSIAAISIMAAFFAMIIVLLYPKRQADIRGDEISRELPFALRHMATELKAGIGLYRTIQAIATSDYGALSEEFARTINEIEEGTDTKLALRHLAQRTQSKALKNALMHVIRALKTGGNLSEIMNDIAQDVSFELRTKVKDFAEKMNFFGVIFIFAAIVMPVFVAVLGGIRNTPIQVGVQNVFETLPLTPEVVTLIYLVFMPLVLGWLLIYILMSQPRV